MRAVSPNDGNAALSAHDAWDHGLNGQRSIALDHRKCINEALGSELEAKLNMDSCALRIRKVSSANALGLELLVWEGMEAADTQGFAWLEVGLVTRVARAANALQTRAVYNWCHHTVWVLGFGGHLTETQSAITHVASLPYDRVIIVDTKKHLPLDARRIGDGFVKALVDPLNDE
jgi:hypothetical protein